jgi:hypothetical protein
MPAFLVIGICWGLGTVLLAVLLGKWLRYLGDTDV